MSYAEISSQVTCVTCDDHDLVADLPSHSGMSVTSRPP